MEDIKFNTGNTKFLLIISFVLAAGLCGLLIGYYDYSYEVIALVAFVPALILSVKYIWIPVAGFFFLIPLNILFVLSSGQTLNKLVAIFLVFLSIITGRILQVSEIFRNRKSIYVLWYGLAALASLFYTNNIDNSLYNLERLWYLIGFYFLLIMIFRDATKLDYVLWAFVFGAVISVIAPFFFDVGRIEDEELSRFGGLWGDQNQFASILVGIMPLSLAFFFSYKSRLAKIAAAASFITLLSGFILTFSRGGYVAFVLTVMIAITANIVKGRDTIRIFLIASITFLLSVIFAYFVFNTQLIGRVETLNVLDSVQSVNAERSLRIRYINYFVIAPKLFVENPVLGSGFHEFIDYSPYKLNAHNTYLEVLTGLGLLGFIPFVMILILTLKEFRIYHNYIIKKSGSYIRFTIASGLQYGFIGYLISSLFISTDTNKMLWIFISISAIMANVMRIDKKLEHQSAQVESTKRRRYVPPQQSRQLES